MTIEELFKDAYHDTNTSESDYPYTKAVRKLNEIYKEIWRMVVQTDEHYFWNYWTTDILEGASEYNIQRKETIVEHDDLTTEVIPGIEKVIKVEILQGEKYVVLPQLDSLEVDAGVKGWYLADNHIILNWIPEEEIEDGLKLYGTQSVNEFSYTNNQFVGDFFPGHEDLTDFLPVIMHGLKKELWAAKQDFEKSDRENQYYEKYKEDMKRYITSRIQQIYYSDLLY